MMRLRYSMTQGGAITHIALLGASRPARYLGLVTPDEDKPLRFGKKKQKRDSLRNADRQFLRTWYKGHPEYGRNPTVPLERLEIDGPILRSIFARQRGACADCGRGLSYTPTGSKFNVYTASDDEPVTASIDHTKPRNYVNLGLVSPEEVYDLEKNGRFLCPECQIRKNGSDREHHARHIQRQEHWRDLRLQSLEPHEVEGFLKKGFSRNQHKGKLRMNKYRPEIPSELNRFPEGQNSEPVVIHELRDSWKRERVRWQRAEDEAVRQDEAAKEVQRHLRQRYSERRSQGTV